MTEPPRGIGEQLSRLGVVTATLLRRSWWQAAAASLLSFGGAVLVGASESLFLDLLPGHPGVLSTIAALSSLAALLAFATALLLAGPLAAFAVARTTEEVRLGAVLARARARLLRVFRITLVASCVPTVPGLLVLVLGALLVPLGAPPPDEAAALFMGLFFFLGVPLFVVFAGFLGLAEAVSGSEPPAHPLERAWELGQGHRRLTLLAVLGSFLPDVAASSTAFAPLRLSGVAKLAPLAGAALSVYAFALLAIATHAVASGEGADT